MKNKLEISEPKGDSFLNWEGKESLETIDYYPAQIKEVYGDLQATAQNKLFWADNKKVLAHLLKNYREKIDLIYLDPPFGSNTEYKKSIKLKNSELKSNYTLIEKKQYDDIWKQEDYFQFVYERLQLMRELLSEKGNIFLHLDWRMDSYIRVILDEIFGRDNFVNRITWKSTNSPKVQSKGLGNQQNSIFWYAKNKEYMTWNQVYKPPTEEYKSRFSHNDQDGRGPYQTVPLVARGVQNTPGRKSFEFKGVEDKWLYSKEKLQEWWDDNRIYTTRNGNYRKKVYLKDCQGSPVSNIWVDSGVSPLQSEGYPTQKPESLLKRIVELGSNEGDLIADFFCGSGTTVVAAERLNRRWIGADINKEAIQTTRNRILTLEQSQLNLQIKSVKSKKSILLQRDDELIADEVLQVEIETEIKDNKLVLRLKDFHSQLVIDKIKAQQRKEIKIEDFTEMISGIYIDFDYKGKFNPTHLQIDDIQKEIIYEYSELGRHNVVLKITDVLGNEKVKKIEIKL